MLFSVSVDLLISVINESGKFIGNLQKIIDLFQKNSFQKQPEVSESQLLKLRKQLLKRLKSDIKTRQKNSLHNLIKIDLEMEEQRHQVGRRTLELAPQDSDNNNPLSRVFKFLNRSNNQTTELEPTQKIIEFLDRDDIQGKLLILGEPGAGKTTELLSLTQDLIQRAEDENTPIPIIFELSTWKNNQPIRDWLIEQLCDIYKGIPKAVAEKWIDEGEIIPLLDGLDELEPKCQNDCINHLNEFLDSRLLPVLVVCCRREEYKQAQTKLERLNGAIYLQSLSDEQIQQYLQSLNRSSIWENTIVNEPSLLKLCRKPLFLTMLVVAYQGRAITNSSELFENYIEKQLNNPDNQGAYPPRKSPNPKQTRHYLIWLAQKLEADGKQEFLIEELQSTWLDPKLRFWYRISVGLIAGMITTSLTGVLMGWHFGIMAGILFGLIAGLAKIEPVEKLDDFSFKKLSWHNWIVGLIVGLSFGSIMGLTVWLHKGWIFGLSFGLIWLLGFSLSVWLTGGRTIQKIKPEEKQDPNQGIVNSLKNSLSVGLIDGMKVTVMMGLPTVLTIGIIKGWMVGLSYVIKVTLVCWLTYGMINALIYGSLAVIQHLILRLFLKGNDDIPWDYAKFLNHAVKHRFIQRVGGRYRFMHDLLRKHFAQMPLN